MFDRTKHLRTIVTFLVAVVLLIGWTPENLNLQYSVQIATFKGKERKTRYELYYAIPEWQLEFARKNGTYTAEVTVNVEVDNARMEKIFQKNELLVIPSSENRKSGNGFYVGQVNFEIGSDLYTHMLTFRTRLRDVNSGLVGNRILRMEHKSYHSTDLQISDLQFVSDISEEPTDSIFKKGSLKVVPYPPEYNIGQRVLYVYFELYGLGLDALGYANYLVDYSVVDIGEGNILPFVDTWGKPFSTDTTSEAGLTAVRVDRAQPGKDQQEFTSIDLSLLNPGLYRFHAQIRDLVQEKVVRATGEFAVGTNQSKK